MWLVTGCFDDEDKASRNTSSKLLKPGQAYNVGRKARKETQIVINKSAISREHGKIIVDVHAVDDVNKPNVIPSIQYINLAKSKTHLVRNGLTEQPNIPQADAVEVQPGDVLQLSSGNDKEPGVSLSFEWRPVYPLFLLLPRPQVLPTSKRAAPLGFKLAKKFSPDITHFIATSLDSSVDKLYSALMASAEIVNEHWWDEMCKRAEAPRGEGKSWEDSFGGLEGIGHWTPALGDGLDIEKLKVDPRRRTLFEGLTFVLFNDASAMTDLTTQLELGGAKVESLDLLESETTSISLLSQLKALQKTANAALSKSNRPGRNTWKTGLCVVLAKQSVQDALGRTWTKYEEMASSLGLDILKVEQIRTSILNVAIDFRPQAEATPSMSNESVELGDTRRANALPLVADSALQYAGSEAGQGASSSGGHKTRTTTDSSLPDEIPPTLPETHAMEGVEVSQVQPAATQFKRRRGRTIMDDLFDDDNVVAEPLPPPPPRGRTPDAPTSSRLPIAPSTTGKRKRTVMQSIFDDSIEEEPQAEPDFKRFKRELEERESNEGYRKQSERAAAVVDAVYRQSKGESVEIPTMTQDELAAARQRRTAATLDEDDELFPTTISQRTTTAGKKRTSAEMEEPDVDDAEDARPAKRQARTTTLDSIPETPAVGQSAPRTLTRSTSPGRSAVVRSSSIVLSLAAANTKPTVTGEKSQSQKAKPAPGAEVPMDTDPKFLQALASRKRGKKKEDQFDRDFNALRIAAPAAGQAAPPETIDDYRVMDDLDFGGPAPPVGNFMRVVLTNEVFRKDRDIAEPGPPRRIGAASVDENGVWRGKKPWDDPKWATRPNYKAFVRNNKHPRQQNVVPVVLQAVDDYGMGSAYWKGDNQTGQSTQKTRKAKANVPHPNPSAPDGLDQDFGILNIAEHQPLRATTARSNKGSKLSSAQVTPARSMSAGDEEVTMNDMVRSTRMKGNSRGRSIEDNEDGPSTSRRNLKRPIHAIEEINEDETEIVAPLNTGRQIRAAHANGSRSSGRKLGMDEEQSLMDVDEPRAVPKRRGAKETVDIGSTLRSSGGKRTPAVSQQEKKNTDVFVVMDDSDDDIRVRRKRRK